MLATVSDNKTLAVVLRQFEDTIDANDTLDCALDPSNSLVVIRNRSHDIYLFDISGTHGGHLIKGFECEGVSSYTWISLGTQKSQQTAQPLTGLPRVHSVNSLLSNPSSPPFSRALAAVDLTEKVIHFFNFSVKNQGITKQINIAKQTPKSSPEAPFLFKFAVGEGEAEVDGLSASISFDQLSKVASTIGSIQCTSVEIVGSSSPGTLVLLVNKKEIFVVFLELDSQSPTSIRLGLRFPLNSGNEALSTSNVVCEGTWLFMLSKDTGFIHIWNYISGKKKAVINAPSFCNLEPKGEEEPVTRDFKHLSVSYDLGYVAFEESSVVYAFHLDLYFQSYPAFVASEQPRGASSTVHYPVVGSGKDEESDEDESEDDEDDEEEDEEHDTKSNFSHWFEVTSPDDFPLYSQAKQIDVLRPWAPTHPRSTEFNGFKSKVTSRPIPQREASETFENQGSMNYGNQGSMNYSSYASSANTLGSSYSQSSMSYYMNPGTSAVSASLGTSVSSQGGMSFASMMNQGMTSTSFTNQGSMSYINQNQGSMSYSNNQGSMNYANNQGSMTFGTTQNQGSQVSLGTTPSSSLTAAVNDWGARRRLGSGNYSALDAVLDEGNLVGEAQQASSISPVSVAATDTSVFYSISPSLLEGGVENIVITPSSILVMLKKTGLTSNDESSGVKVLMLSKKSGEISMFMHDQLALPVLQHDSLVYYLTSVSLFSVIVGQTQQDLLHNAIMFQGAAAADQLCALNGWDRRSLRMHALFLGLRYRQLDVVEPALRSLDADQQLPAAAQLREFLGGAASMDKVFVEQLLLIAMNFMSLVIKDRAEKVHTESVKETLGTKAEEEWWHAGGSVQSGPLAELLTFTNSLETLREAYHAQQAKKPPVSLTVKGRSGSNSKSKSNFGSYMKLPIALELDPPSGLNASFEHWNSLDENEVVREAILHGAGGKISYALGYLRRRREQRSGEPQALTFEQFKQIGYCLVYQFVCHDQVDHAIKMLRNMGERPSAHLEEIAFHTSRRSIRTALLPMLQISDDMKKVIEYSQLLETLYPGTWYSREFTKASMKSLPVGKSTWVPNDETASFHGAHVNLVHYQHRAASQQQNQEGEEEDDEEEDEPLPQDLDDIMQSAEQKYNFHVLAPTSVALTPPSTKPVNKARSGSIFRSDHVVEKNKITIQAAYHSSSVGSLAHTVPMKGETPAVQHTGYTHYTLSWVSKWDEETKERILIDKQYNMNERSIWSLLVYHVSHNNWRQIVSWVKNLPKEVPDILREELQHILQTGTFSEKASVIGKKLQNALSKATLFVREILFTELAKQKIFLPNLEAASDPSMTLMEAFLNRLARSYLLFQHTPHTSALQEILPTGSASAFHHFFVRFCAQNNIPFVLNAFLESYGLGKTKASADSLWENLVGPAPQGQFSQDKAAPISGEYDWVRLLLLLRNREGSSLFEASLLQAKALLQTTKTPNIKDMLMSNQLFMALATLCYAPVSIDAALSSAQDAPWHVDAPSLTTYLHKYPTLKSALFPGKADTTEINPAHYCVANTRDIYTSKRDISLKELLDDTSPFFLDHLFGTKSDREPASTFPEIPDFTHPRFVSIAEVDNLDVFYYLEKGRPMRAYQHLAFAVNGKPNSPVKLNQHQQLRLQFELRNFALQHKDYPLAAGACVTLCILCNIDPVLVRVDFDAFVRIDNYLKKENQVMSVLGISDPMELFLRFYDKPGDLLSNRPTELARQTLALLERATPLTHSIPSELGLVAGPWDLVSHFCQAHHLPLSPAHLIFLAEGNDWIRFLYEAQEQGFKPDQVFAISKEHFKDPNLRSHLSIVIGNMMTPPPKLSQERSREDEADVLQIAHAAHRRPYPGKTLLLQSHKTMRPLLAILAACYDDVKILDCLMQWLCAKCDPLLANLYSQAVVTTGGFEAFDIYADAVEAPSSEEWKGYHLDHVTSAILKLFNQKNYQPLVRAFTYFDPNNPILDYIQFAFAFSQYRYSDAELHITKFVANVHLDKSANAYKIGSNVWAQAQAQSLTELLLDQAPTDYEQSHLLSLVHNASLSPSLSRLHITFSLLRRTSLPRELLRAPPTSIITKLLDNGLFNEARHYAADNELETEDITLREVQGLVNQYRQSCLWDIEQERMNLWSKCQQSFMEHKIRPIVAGDFFYNLGNSTEKSASERMVLLSFALGWYSGIYTNQANIPSQSVPITAESALSLSGKFSSSTAIKPVSLLQEIENQVLLLSLGVSMEGELANASPPSSPGPRSPKSSMLLEPAALNSSDSREMGLDLIVGRLLNSGNIQKAEEICKQFNYTPRDFEIVKTITNIAERTIDCNITYFPASVAAILRQRFPGQDFTAVKNEIEMMETLTSCCISAHHYCRQVLVKCRVAQALSLTYNQVRGKHEYDILEHLVRKGKETFRLSRSFIQVCHLDSSKIATMLGDLYFRAIVDNFAKLINNESASKLEKNVENGVDANWSAEDFTEYADLSRDPYNVGQRLLELTGLSPSLTGSFSHTPASYNPALLDTEVELLVRAHQCFVFSCSLQGSTSVLNVVKSRVKEYVKAGEFKLLVRLITGMQCYQELQYLLDFLLAYDRFELLLRKRINNDEGQHALRLALHSYLLKQAPEHRDKLEMLFLRFNMHREIADTLEAKARKLMESLGNVKPSMAIRPDVLQAMQWYLDAADNYVKEKAFKTANQCFSMAALLGLQARLPDTRMLNLKPAEARQLLTFTGSLRDANIIAAAYDLNKLPEWVAPLYQQVILSGNMTYLEDFVATVPGHSAVFPELVKRFKSDSASVKNNHKVQSFKQLLSHVEDKVLRYELAKELNYEDVAQNVASSTPGFDYFLSSISSKDATKGSPLKK